MARKLKVAHHLKRVKAHHKRHRKRLLQLYHKVRQHPGCYKAGYGPRRGAKVPRSHPRRPRGLNKKGAGLWSAIKSGWSWLTGHGKKIAKEVGKEAMKHAKVHGKALLEEGKKRAISYGKAQLERGTQWAKGQASAAGERVRKKVEKHISDATSKVEAIASRVNKGVSKYSGATTGMPGRTVAAKTGSGWLGDRFRGGMRRAARGIWRMGTRRR
jgi:hypothetical protein